MQLGTLREQADRAQQAADASKARFDQATQALAETEAALLAFTDCITLADLAEFQQALDHAERQRAAIQSLADAQQAVIDQAQTTLPAVPDLQPERQALLADIAMGNATEADLKALDRRIREASGNAEQGKATASPIIDRAAQTLAGLRGKLATAEADLQALNEKRRDLLLGYLQTEAEAEGKKYAELGLAAFASLKRILSLNTLGASLAGRDFAGDFWSAFQVPVLPLKACSEHELKNWNGFIAKADTLIYASQLAETTEAERAAIRQAGAGLL